MKTSVKFSLASLLLAIVAFFAFDKRLALPPEPAITDITVKLHGFRPEIKGYLTNSFTVAKSDYSQFLRLFTGAKRTLLPMKWQCLGTATITTKANQTTTVDLYSTFQERGAFSIGKKCFRTVSEPETLKFLTSNYTTVYESK